MLHEVEESIDAVKPQIVTATYRPCGKSNQGETQADGILSPRRCNPREAGVVEQAIEKPASDKDQMDVARTEASVRRPADVS
jgi:hypothetical protein